MGTDLTGTLSISGVRDELLLSGDRHMSLLKQAAILCDQIFVNTTGEETFGESQEEMVAGYLGGDEGSFLMGSRRFRDMIVLPRDLGDENRIMNELIVRSFDDGLEDLRTHTFDGVRAIPDEELERFAFPRRGSDYKVRGALGMQIVKDIALPSFVERWIDNPVGLLTPLHHRVLANLLNRQRQPIDVIRELDADGVIDFGALSWREILRLRRSGFRDDFRGRLEEIAATDDPAGAAAWGDLWKFARESVPSPGRTLVTGILGSLPLPFFNPVGLAATVAQAQRDGELRRDYGWLFFILEATPSLG
jgi:hypothetical protein